MPHPDMNEFWTDGHPDEGLLHEWLDEQLSAADASTVAAHVAECAECSAAVAEARGLIAASHRILSALDDVPAGVIPQNLQQAAQASESSIDFNKRVEELRNTRVAVASASSVPARSSTRWRQAGKIAALLLIAIIPGVYFLRGDDVTAPMAAPGAGVLATTERAVTQPDAAAPQSTSDMAGADSAAPTPLAKSAPAAESRAAGAVAAVPAPPSRQLRDDAVARAGDNRRAAFASRAASDSGGVAGSAAASAEAMKKSASNTVAKTEEAPPGAMSSALLSGKAAGAAVSSPANSNVAAASPPIVLPAQQAVAPRAAADQASRTAGVRAGARGDVGPAATPPAPIPQLSASPLPFAARVAREQTPDTLRHQQVLDDALLGNGEILKIPAGATFSSSSAVGNLIARFVFDSMVLSRTVCASSCETTRLHLTYSGRVRLEVSAGGRSLNSVVSQLALKEQSAIVQSIAAVVPTAATREKTTRCNISNASGAPILGLLIVRPENRPMNTQATSNDVCPASAVLLELGATIDSIARTMELRQRVR